jgi:hypothetical protein
MTEEQTGLEKLTSSSQALGAISERLRIVKVLEQVFEQEGAPRLYSAKIIQAVLDSTDE